MRLKVLRGRWKWAGMHNEKLPVIGVAGKSGLWGRSALHSNGQNAERQIFMGKLSITQLFSCLNYF